VDAPKHFFDDGAGAESLSLEVLCGAVQVVELDTRTAIAAADLAAFDLSDAARLLIKTRNSRLWGSPVFHADFIGVSESAARLLVDRGVKVLGVDYLSVEAYKTPGAPAHHVLLGAGTIVIEGLDLHEVAPGHYEMFCLPLRIVGSDGAPARVVLRRS
jgi:arylformamidase